MENRQYKKDELIKTYPYEDGRLLATILIGGAWIANPTEAQFLADGWERYTPAPVPPYEPTRSEKIHADIRARYTENDEFMILRQYSANPADEKARGAFETYNAYVEEVLARYPEE